MLFLISVVPIVCVHNAETLDQMGEFIELPFMRAILMGASLQQHRGTSSCAASKSLSSLRHSCAGGHWISVCGHSHWYKLLVWGM